MNIQRSRTQQGSTLDFASLFKLSILSLQLSLYTKLTSISCKPNNSEKVVCTVRCLTFCVVVVLEVFQKYVAFLSAMFFSTLLSYYAY